MREITTHKVNGCNIELEVIAVDQAGHGNSCHRYQIIGPERKIGNETAPSFLVDLRFQNGPIAEVGTNGITHESLLSVLIDRLEGFQSGPYAHGYNADALKSLRSALASLKQRTLDRIHRGVEGTHKV